MTRMEELLEGVVLGMPEPERLRKRAARRRARRFAITSTLAGAVFGIAVWAAIPGDRTHGTGPAGAPRPGGSESGPIFWETPKPYVDPYHRRFPPGRLEGMLDLWLSLDCESPEGPSSRMVSMDGGAITRDEGGALRVERNARYRDHAGAKAEVAAIRQVLEDCGLKLTGTEKDEAGWITSIHYDGRDTSERTVSATIDYARDWVRLTEFRSKTPAD
ncbi:hypothetical protein JNUCC64_10625 [Streptomyces sp. JNUCC 64]